jgi:hypothetical protein
MLTDGAVDYETSGHRATTSELSGRYDAYRRRQARALLRVVPQGAIRPLYRRALKAGFTKEGASDPMGVLVRYCETLLPLPPFEAWRQDVRQNPTAHLYDVDDSAEAPGADAPVTVETRVFSHADHQWLAHLRSFRDGVTWRGFIAFEDSRSHLVHRTAVIFREADPVDVRDRFLSFESSALVAFLRSALP